MGGSAASMRLDGFSPGLRALRERGHDLGTPEDPRRGGQTEAQMVEERAIGDRRALQLPRRCVRPLVHKQWRGVKPHRDQLQRPSWLVEGGENRLLDPPDHGEPYQSVAGEVCPPPPAFKMAVLTENENAR